MMNKPLQHLTVVEFASVLAGPLTGSFLAELGATVIKIENKVTQGDVTRSWRSKGESSEGISAYYASANSFKQVMFLDLSNPTDKAEAMLLVGKSDLVISNFKTKSAEKLGLTFAAFKAVNPNIIHAQIQGFAHEADRAAYDVVLQAETGFMSMNGQAGSAPTKMPIAMIDILAAHQLKQGILLALLQQTHAKKALQVTVNLEQAAMSALANQASNWLMNKQIAQQMGSLHPNIAPYGETFCCADNTYVVLAIGSNQQFAHLCNILKIEHLANDDRFNTNPQRVSNRIALQEAMAPAFKTLTSTAFQTACNKLHVPVGMVKNMQQVFESSAAENMVITETINGQTLQKVANVAFDIS